MKTANNRTEVPVVFEWLLPAQLSVFLTAKHSHSCNVQINNLVYHIAVTINTTITDNPNSQRPWKEAICTRIQSDMGKS